MKKLSELSERDQEIAEAILNGVEGAFSGARKGGKPGKFELANHGSMFLEL